MLSLARLNELSRPKRNSNHALASMMNSSRGVVNLTSDSQKSIVMAQEFMQIYDELYPGKYKLHLKLSELTFKMFTF